MRFVLATANPDKAGEIAEVLHTADPGIELIERPQGVPEVDETGETLEENARLKAAALCTATGLPAIADDTGLEVDVLGGAPGVHSARYAGAAATYAANVARLLAELDGFPLERRTARFSTVAVARWPDGLEVAAIGSVEGVITAAPRGVNGFGYDPVFVPVVGDGRTFAEMTAEEKHAHSHRGEALRTLAQGLRVVQHTEGRPNEGETGGAR
jgi:XTP/dITP diphosphohydrolase